MRYLITGGCGFLGCNLAAKGLALGHHVTLLDNLSRPGSRPNLAWLESENSGHPPDFIYGDTRHAADIADAVKKVRPDVVFHLAGQVAMTTSITDPRGDFETNALGTFNLLEAVREHAPQASLLYSSTNKVYGDLEWVKYEELDTRYAAPDYPHGFDEKMPLDFYGPYGCSKGTADQYVLNYSRIYGLKTAVFRHSAMFGGRQFATFDQGWVGWFCQQALAIRDNPHREPFTIAGNGKQVRDILYADDVAEFYYRTAENIAAIQGQAFNVGGGMENSFSLLELFAFLENELNIRMYYTRLEPRQGDQKLFVADSRVIEERLGWKVTVPKAQGVRNILSWLQSL
jgi:CDP-paratose 2-epimerase